MLACVCLEVRGEGRIGVRSRRVMGMVKPSLGLVVEGRQARNDRAEQMPD